MTRQELIDHLKLGTPDMNEHLACIVWSAVDVLQRADELETPVSDQEANDIIDRVGRKADCSMGISWATLDVFIDECINQRVPCCDSCMRGIQLDHPTEELYFCGCVTVDKYASDNCTAYEADIDTLNYRDVMKDNQR